MSLDYETALEDCLKEALSLIKKAMIMEFIRYILGDFWHFAGFLLILWIILVGITDIVREIKK